MEMAAVVDSDVQQWQAEDASPIDVRGQHIRAAQVEHSAPVLTYDVLYSLLGSCESEAHDALVCTWPASRTWLTTNLKTTEWTSR